MKIKLALFSVLICLSSLCRATGADLVSEKRWSYLNISTKVNNQMKYVILIDSALYGINSPNNPVSGQLVSILSSSSLEGDGDKPSQNHMGCSAYLNQNLPAKYVALVQRGECSFEQKVKVAIENNASAIIIYNVDQNILNIYSNSDISIYKWIKGSELFKKINDQIGKI